MNRPKSITIGIDASNIRTGGGLTHLESLLNMSKPQKHGFEKIYVWASDSTLEQLPSLPWLQKEKVLHQSHLLNWLRWQKHKLPYLVKQRCDMLFVPGGIFTGSFQPVVAMSHTMLPFSWNEILRYGFSSQTPKLVAQQFLQTSTFRRANGIIFLSNYAKNIIGKYTSADSTIIAHGIDSQFFFEPRKQRSLSSYTHSTPYKLLYVSHFVPYKNHPQIIEATRILRKEFHLPVQLILAGHLGRKPDKLMALIADADPKAEFIKHIGAVPHSELHRLYQSSDAFVFASSCENLPITLLEAMAAGLPVASSNRGPMPEVLQDAGLFFDPYKAREIAVSLKLLIGSSQLRQSLAKKSYELAKRYTWENCVDATFHYFNDIFLK